VWGDERGGFGGNWEGNKRKKKNSSFHGKIGGGVMHAEKLHGGKEQWTRVRTLKRGEFGNEYWVGRKEGRSWEKLRGELQGSESRSQKVMGNSEGREEKGDGKHFLSTKGRKRNGRNGLKVRDGKKNGGRY